MSSVRALFAALLALLFLIPALLPLLSLTTPTDRGMDLDAARPLSLLANTAGLTAVAVAIATPCGSALAVLLARGPVRGAAVIRYAILVGLFVPLPVYAVAWQAVLARWLPPLPLEPGAVAWRAWTVGLLPAGFVHGMAGVPWVAWIVGDILARTDRDLEDDATQTGGPWDVVRRVIVPRALRAVTLASAWIGVQVMTEIPVSDAMMVRTFAEEVYTRLVIGEGGVASAVAVTIPVWVGGVLVGLLLRRRAEASANISSPSPLRFAGWVTPTATLFAWLLVGLFAGLPLFALTATASAGGLASQLLGVIRSNGAVLLVSLLWAGVTGLGVAVLARWACWLAVRSTWLGRFLFVLGVILILTPGPLIGLGLKEAIRWLVNREDALFTLLGVRPTFPPLASVLYDRPSPLPGVWAAAVRLFPIACLLIWPSLRAVPRDLWEAVALDGHGMRAEWRLVAGPFTRTGFVRAAVAVAALTLGEVSAGKLVSPPGHETYILRLFAQMHYGAESTVAALCLIQIVLSSLFAVVLGWGRAVRGPE